MIDYPTQLDEIDHATIISLYNDPKSYFNG